MTNQVMHAVVVVVVRIRFLNQAGMGGGAGSGAAPVVAEIARQQGAFTVAVAATPTSLSARQTSTQVGWWVRHKWMINGWLLLVGFDAHISRCCLEWGTHMRCVCACDLQAVHDLYKAADALVMLPTHKLLAGR